MTQADGNTDEEGTAPDGSITLNTYTPDGFVASVTYPDQTVSFGIEVVPDGSAAAIAETLVIRGLG